MTAEQELRFWPPVGVTQMVPGPKLQLTPAGAFLFGTALTRLEWCLTTSTERVFITQFLAPLTQFTQIERFELIGNEATGWHNALSNRYEQFLPISDMDQLRNAKTRWETIAAERLGDMYLATPQGVLQPKALLGGVAGFLSTADVTFLAPIERHDLNEACMCMLIGSTTAAEMIALRAAESLLRRWYTAKTGKIIERGSWGAVFDRLQKEYPQESARPIELAALGYLSLRRNAIDHPEVISAGQDAVSTLTTVCSLVGRVRPIVTLPPASQSGPGSNAP